MPYSLQSRQGALAAQGLKGPAKEASREAGGMLFPLLPYSLQAQLATLEKLRLPSKGSQAVSSLWPLWRLRKARSWVPRGTRWRSSLRALHLQTPQGAPLLQTETAA